MGESVAFAYSGGLDTSVILAWLVEQGYEVHAVYTNVGQPGEDPDKVMKKARNTGAKSAHIADAREELCRDFAFKALMWGAKYEGMYLMGTSLARPLIARCTLEVAREVGAHVFAHGATGKGNDQCRFQLAANALAPDIRVLAPWRVREFRERFPGRKEMIEFAAERGIPVKATKEKPYSSDDNCLHVSYEAGVLEDPGIESFPKIDFAMTVSPEDAPDKAQTVRVEFKDGVPAGLGGADGAIEKLSPFQLVDRLNKIAGKNGIGRVDMVENRFVGMKSRGVYEAPAMTVLYDAHAYVEQLTMDRDLLHLRDRLAVEVSELVYNGYWYSAKMDALDAFIREAQKNVSGTATLKLYKGNVVPISRVSPNSLYDESVATMEGGGSYDQSDAEGFLKIAGLPLRVQSSRRKRKL